MGGYALSGLHQSIARPSAAPPGTSPALRLIRPTPSGSPVKRSAAGNLSGVNVIATHPAQYSYFSVPAP
jgi:hypothetical protein